MRSLDHVDVSRYKYEIPDEDIAELVANIRAGDMRELVAIGGDPATQIKKEAALSEQVCVARIEGEIVAVFGVVPSKNGKSCGMWMLSTKAADLRKRDLLLYSEIVVDHVQDIYGKIFVEVDNRYEKSVRWLNYLGFVSLTEIVHNGIPFSVMMRG